MNRCILCTKPDFLMLGHNSVSLYQDVTNLMHLSNLRQLSLCDSMYAPSPVALLCNYSTHIIYHLLHLQRLDGHLIDHPELQKVVQVGKALNKVLTNDCGI